VTGREEAVRGEESFFCETSEGTASSRVKTAGSKTRGERGGGGARAAGKNLYSSHTPGEKLGGKEKQKEGHRPKSPPSFERSERTIRKTGNWMTERRGATSLTPRGKVKKKHYGGSRSHVKGRPYACSEEDLLLWSSVGGGRETQARWKRRKESLR